MNTNDWRADSGINIRELVYGLLSVARRYTSETDEEETGVKILIIDGDDFSAATGEG